MKHLERLAGVLVRPAQAGVPAPPLCVHTCCLTFLAAKKKQKGTLGGMHMSRGRGELPASWGLVPGASISLVTSLGGDR